MAAYIELDELIGFDWDGVADAITIYVYGNNQANDGGIVQGVFYHTPYRDQEEETGSLEIRLAANLNQDVTYVAGLYYFNTDYQLYASNLAFGDVVTGLQDTSQETTSVAAFGEVKWSINDQWRVNAGVRYTRDEKDFKHSLSDDFDASYAYSCEQGYYVADPATCAAAEAGLIGTAPYAQADTDDSWSEVTPRVGVDYQINDQMMSYASLSTGYKAGGFNGRGGTDQIAQSPYDPETVTSFEVGFKSQFWDNRARLNSAAFVAEYEDMQTEVTVPTVGGTGQTPVIMNAGEARTQDVEVEFLVLPLPDTEINISYGWLDSEFTELEANLFGETDINGDIIIYYFDGNRLRRSPENTFSASINQGSI